MRTSINKKSDFDFIVLDSEGNAIDMPTSDFTLDLWTWGSKCRFRASSIDGVLKGCKNDGGKLRVYVDNPGFVPGKLVGEWITYAASEDYADGSQRTCRYISDFGIDMVDGDSITNEQQVLAMMQYIQGASAYEIACEHGYQGTEEEWLNSLSLESVNAANECRELMTQLSAAEDERNATEQTRIANEQARNNSEGHRALSEEYRCEEEEIRKANEQTRQAAESIRKDAENYRITHENSRESNETIRQNSETARVAAEESRVAAEKSRQAAEQARETAEVSRAAAEEERKRTHDRLKTAMREYADAESLREEAEAERREAEQYRIEYEQSRQSAEADRLTNERSRVATESQRVTNETARSNAESSRATAETARQAAETSRQEAEQGRATAEQARADAEAARAEEFATFEGKIAAKEDVANKVTSINADADDEHYPSAKAVWSAIEEKFWYGVEWDLTISSPTCTRIGNMDLHRTLPVQLQMRGCLLADDGTVNKYLNPDDWTSEVRDGSQGMVMVELPRYFRKFETEGNKLRVKLSLLPLDGFHEVKKKYVSAYEAAIERSTGKLCSVVNEGTNYRGGNNDSSWDGTYKSQLGMPVSNMSITNARGAARKRGSKNWNCYTYDVLKDVYWMYVCEYATLDCQKGYTEELSIDGYRQGGLGEGLSGVKDWNGYNSKRPLAKCGLTDYAGNKTTQLPLHLVNDDVSKEENIIVSRYRGIENLFGHLWKSVDGVIIKVSPSEANGGDGTSKVYVSENPNYFNNSDITNYNHIANESRVQSCVKKIAFGERGDIVPTVCENVGTNSYYSTYHFTNTNTNGIANRGWIVGGDATGKLLNSFIFVYSSYSPSEILMHEGSRLCYIPTENFE